MMRIRARQTPFVDRKDEMEVLKRLSEDVLAGHGRTILISGEAGVGKSRLVMEFAERAKEKGFKLISCQCLYHSDTDPYLPFMDALRQLKETKPEVTALGFVPADGSESEIPLVLTGLEEKKGIAKAATLEEERRRMFNRVIVSLETASKRAPLIFFIDDLQWSDIASLQLFHYLVRAIENLRIMLIACYRPEDIRTSDDSHPLTLLISRMSREHIYTSLQISRLSFSDVKNMVLGILNVKSLPERFLAFLYNETEGNPLFVEEIIYAMIEEGLLDTSRLIWEFKIDPEQVKIPATIRELISRRIAGLQPDDKKVLMYASVIGNYFDFDILRKATEMEETQLLDVIDRLIQMRLIRESSQPGERYEFDHFQVRAVMYESLSRSRRRFIHAKIGELLENKYKGKEEEHAFALARHFVYGDIPAKALRYSIMAGERALHALALHEAVDHFNNAANIIENLPPSPENDEKAITVYLNLGRIQYDLGAYSEAQKHYERVAQIAERSGDRMHHALALTKIGHIHTRRGRMDEALSSHTKALEIARSVGADAVAIDALRGLGYRHWRLGEIDQAIEKYSEAMPICDRIKDEHFKGILFIDIGNAYAVKGDLEKAKEYYKLSMEIMKRLNDPFEYTRALNNLGDVYLQEENWKLAVETFEEIYQIAGQTGDKIKLGWSLFNAAEALVEMGEIDRADEYIQKAFSLLLTEKDTVGVAGCHRIKGCIHHARKEYPQAIQEFKTSIEILETAKIPFEIGQALMYMAKTYYAMGEKENAKNSLEKAKEIMQRVGSTVFLKKIEKVARSMIF
jgi:tetratricopeptide (TPR) repeat protein